MKGVTILGQKIQGWQMQVFVSASIMLVIIALLGGVKFWQISKAIAEHSNFQPPPEAITTMVVQEGAWASQYDAVGSFAAVQGVTLAAEEPGKIVKIEIESGAKVEKDQVLIQIDTSVEEANFKAAQAKAQLAKQNLARALNLQKSSAVAQSNVDQYQSESRQAEADAASIRAVIEKKRIVAPFSGRAGIRMVNVGQYVSQGTPIIPLFSLDPIYLNFSIPQQMISRVALGSSLTAFVDAFNGEPMVAKVTAINPNVDVATRNIEIQATVENKSEKLKPGMFASLALDLSGSQSVIAVPSSAIVYAPYGDAVYVIEPADPEKNKGQPGKMASQRVVKLGERRGDRTVILSGLKAGDEIATSGVFKLRPQVIVFIDNKIAPSNELTPKVENS